jgi:hypothetical protein
MYKLNKSIAIGQITSIVKKENGVTICIPIAPDNTDYQAYLKWVSEGNTPEQAD